MSDLEQYLELSRRRPDLFSAPPDGPISILLEPEEIAEVEALMESRLQSKGASPEQAHDWSRVGVAFQDQYVFLVRDAVRFGDGSLGTYIRIIDPDISTPGVIILPFYRGQIVFIRHFRHATRAWSWEIPRGFGRPGLSDEENARRELLEEISAEIVRLLPLGMAQPDAAASSETNAMFFAEIQAYGSPEVAEGISDIRLASVEEFEREIAEDRIIDGFTLCAYAKAKARGLL